MGEEDEVPIQAELLQSNKENDMYAGFAAVFGRDADEHTGPGCGGSRPDKRGVFLLDVRPRVWSFLLYRVADYKDTGGFALTEKFQNYRVSLESDEWRGTARTLADYAERDGIQADAVLKSGSDKTVCFENLSNGLYLVKGQAIDLQENGKAKISVPPVSLIALPDASQKDPLHIKVNMKYDEEESDNIEVSQTKIHVLKVWKQDQAKERPASVQVDLLRTDQDGTTTVADSQILEKENQWSYTWEDHFITGELGAWWKQKYRQAIL